MSMNQDGRQARAQMETAKAEVEKKSQQLPRRFGIYDKIKDNVSLRTIDTIIIATSVLIVVLLVVGILTGNPQQ
ncbi:MAG: hypothetical protein J6K73_04180 [Clostridia bacterium]|nr:hypothetical protein [Clostridia bacterium]MBP3648964.1 hypothetical protein [Clostridia bacterium]